MAGKNERFFIKMFKSRKQPLQYKIESNQINLVRNALYDHKKNSILSSVFSNINFNKHKTKFEQTKQFYGLFI